MDMSTGTGCSLGVLPPALPSTARVEYYVEATDRTFDTSRTDQFDLPVVATADACPAGTAPAPPARDSAFVLSGPAGAPETPDGFVGGRAVVSGGRASASPSPAPEAGHS